jgi:Ca2+-transporting ATPase
LAFTLFICYEVSRLRRAGVTDFAAAGAIAFSSLIVGNVFLILTSLSDTRNFVSVILENNKALVIISTIAFTLLFLTIGNPMLQKIFSFEYPGH